MRPKDKAVSLRLPEKLLEAVRGEAKREGVPSQRFIRMAIETALQKSRAQMITAPVRRAPSFQPAPHSLSVIARSEATWRSRSRGVLDDPLDCFPPGLSGSRSQ
jgi:hypothetical protein